MGYRLVALRQVEFSYYKDVDWPRGRKFGALAQVFGRSAITFLRKYVVPAGKGVGAALIVFAAPEIAEVVCGRKSFKSSAKCVGRHYFEKTHG